MSTLVRSTNLPPRHELSPADIEQASKAWFKTAVPPQHRRLVAQFNRGLRSDFVNTEDRAVFDRVLALGGTIPFGLMKRQTPLTASGEEGPNLTKVIDDLKFAMKGLTGINYTRSSVKSNGPLKPGIGPHRDSSLDGEYTGNVLSISATGRGRFFLWVVPESCEVDAREALDTQGLGLENPLIVEVGGSERSLYPVSYVDTYPGVAVNINETPGVGTWEGAEGQTRLWHSAVHLSETPRLALIIRDKRPSPSA